MTGGKSAGKVGFMFSAFTRKDGSPVLVNPRLVDTVMPQPVDGQGADSGLSIIAFGGKDVIVIGHYEDIADVLASALLDVYRKKAEAAAPATPPAVVVAGQPAGKAETAKKPA